MGLMNPVIVWEGWKVEVGDWGLSLCVLESRRLRVAGSHAGQSHPLGKGSLCSDVGAPFFPSVCCWVYVGGMDRRRNGKCYKMGIINRNLHSLESFLPFRS